jgi:hypothetical protein
VTAGAGSDAAGSKRPDERSTLRGIQARPIDTGDERLSQVPSLLSPETANFDRAILMAHGAQGREAATRLARWLCSGLAALKPEERKGLAIIQLDEPLGQDLVPFQDNVFFPADPVVAIITGTPALVNDICVGAVDASSSRSIGGARFGHRLPSLPVWSIAQNGQAILPDAGYFAGMEKLLLNSGWRVWALEWNLFSMGWGAPAEALLADLPEKVPARKR